MSEVYVLRLCEQCVNMLLEFITVRTSQAEEVAKCEFCKKKKPCSYYRVMSERSAKFDRL